MTVRDPVLMPCTMRQMRSSPPSNDNDGAIIINGLKPIHVRLLIVYKIYNFIFLFLFGFIKNFVTRSLGRFVWLVDARK